MDNKKILIIVPAFNEGENIRQTVDEIKTHHPTAQVLVVNDGSEDSTAEVAKQTDAKVVSLPFNLGIGGAVQTGFKYAYKHGFDIAVQVDGDGQHDASFLGKLFDPIERNDADVVIGSRFIEPFVGYQSSFVRRIGINFFANLISFLLKCTVSDPTSGFRAYNQKAIQLFAQDYPRDYPEPEAIVVAIRHGLRVVETPVEMRKRTAGQSSIRYLWTLYYMVKVTFAICLDMIKPKRILE